MAIRIDINCKVRNGISPSQIAGAIKYAIGELLPNASITTNTVARDEKPPKLLLADAQKKVDRRKRLGASGPHDRS